MRLAHPMHARTREGGGGAFRLFAFQYLAPPLTPVLTATPAAFAPHHGAFSRRFDTIDYLTCGAFW